MDKVKILRDLEYVSGGLTALKHIFSSDKENAPYYELFQDWNDIIYNVIDQIAKERIENAQNFR